MSLERVFTGTGVSHGIAIGPAHIVQWGRPQAPRYNIPEAEIAAEAARLENAADAVRRELEALKAQSAALPDAGAEEVLLLLEAHIAMVSGSRLLRGAAGKITTQRLNAEAALAGTTDELAAQFRALNDPYIASRIDDIEAVGNRLLRHLLKLPFVSLDDVPPGGIVIAKEISPADTAQLDPRRFAGLATVHGGAAGHTAIMARSLGLPAVLSLPAEILHINTQGAMVIVDGIEGRLIVSPSAETLAQYGARSARLAEDRQALSTLAQLPAQTADGTAITLRANLEIPRETPAIRASGAAGIGLFRTEFLFMNRRALPDEQEQFNAMAEVVREMQGAEVTFRTLDIGGDKLAQSLGPSIGEAANPALGLRAIRLSLKEPQLFKTQLRAILRLGALGPVRVLLPMVTTAAEVEAARQLMVRCRRELQQEGVPQGEKLPPLGTMIEIPAAALSADSLAVVSDFFALGTNDLVQYTVAIDRGNDQVAALYNPLNPAVLRLIEFTVEAARRADIPVSICGEIAADPKYTGLLLGLGLREFSVGFSNVPRIKQRLRALDLAAAEEHARAVMNQYDPARIAELVTRFAAGA